MNALTEFLFPAPAPRTTWQIVRWWESRRLAYNAIVGGAGLVTLAVARLVTWLPPDPIFQPVFDWRPIVAYGVLANLCYLMGPAIEAAIHKLWGREVLPTGPALFRMGLTFSVGLTLLPILLVVLGWIFRVLGAVA